MLIAHWPGVAQNRRPVGAIMLDKLSSQLACQSRVRAAEGFDSAGHSQKLSDGVKVLRHGIHLLECDQPWCSRLSKIRRVCDRVFEYEELRLRQEFGAMQSLEALLKCH